MSTLPPTYLERLNALKTAHPEGEFITNLFVGWMCGSAAGEDAGNRGPVSLSTHVEQFLTQYEGEVSTPPTSATSAEERMVAAFAPLAIGVLVEVESTNDLVKESAGLGLIAQEVDKNAEEGALAIGVGGLPAAQPVGVNAEKLTGLIAGETGGQPLGTSGPCLITDQLGDDVDVLLTGAVGQEQTAEELKGSHAGE